MDHTRHTPLQAAELNEANLIDAVIYGPSDEKIGTVAHVHGMGAATQVIVDVGGFLGIGSKPVAENGGAKVGHGSGGIVLLRAA